MKNKDKVIEQLQVKADAFWLAINEVADYEFEWTVKPWLVKKGYRFYTGTGVWGIFDGGRLLDNSEIPNRILDVLEITIPLYDHELGSIMPCFPED